MRFERVSTNLTGVPRLAFHLCLTFYDKMLGMKKEPSKAEAFSDAFHAQHSPTSEVREQLKTVGTVRHETRTTKDAEIQDRYIFDDGSVIVVTDYGFGSEGFVPWTWRPMK